MTCRHPYVGPISRSYRSPRNGMEINECNYCNELLGMGPANDTPDALVELRAAEIAAHKFDMQFRLSTRFQTNGGEMSGWLGEETIDVTFRNKDGLIQTDRDVPLNLDSPNWRAGYLARVVTSNDDHGDE